MIYWLLRGLGPGNLKSSGGGLAEWLKAAVLKTAVGFEPTGGSNPSPSANPSFVERWPSG